MKYTVHRDAGSGRFAAVTITPSGEVVTTSGVFAPAVRTETFRKAKKAANTSMRGLGSKP